MKQLMTRDEALTLQLWQRELVLKERKLTPVEPQYCIVWEDPADMDSPVKVMIPSPQWLAMAMHGNVLPPVGDANPPVDENGAVIEGHALHDNVIGALTEEQAMKYLLQKDVPARVWNAPQGNRRRFVITRREMISTDRVYRNAWRLTQFVDETTQAA